MRNKFDSNLSDINVIYSPPWRLFSGKVPHTASGSTSCCRCPPPCHTSSQTFPPCPSKVNVSSRNYTFNVVSKSTFHSTYTPIVTSVVWLFFQSVPSTRMKIFAQWHNTFLRESLKFYPITKQSFEKLPQSNHSKNCHRLFKFRPKWRNFVKSSQTVPTYLSSYTYLHFVHYSCPMKPR